jgi:hypothetical protein
MEGVDWLLVDHNSNMLSLSFSGHIWRVVQPGWRWWALRQYGSASIGPDEGM